MTDKLVLGSVSPRRKELMSMGGWEFDVLPAQVNEDLLPGEGAREYVLRMAETKACEVAKHTSAGSLVIAADTTVVDPQGTILAKPSDDQEAYQMLESLRGATHQVLTAVAVLRASDGVLEKEICVTDVRMRSYSHLEMHAYIASGDPFDKAGGYAIQNEEFHPVEEISGCYANVVGLPICTLAHLLEMFDIEAYAQLPKDCSSTQYSACSICERLNHPS